MRTTWKHQEFCSLRGWTVGFKDAIVPNSSEDPADELGRSCSIFLCIYVFPHSVQTQIQNKRGAKTIRLKLKLRSFLSGPWVIHYPWARKSAEHSNNKSRLDQGGCWLTSLWWGLWGESEMVAYEVNCSFSRLFYLLCWTFSHPTELSSSFLQFSFGRAKNRIKKGRAVESWSG